MVAYSYKKRFAQPILDLTKPQTMRNERARHARPGELIQHYTGMRTRHCRKLGISTCIGVTPVRLDFQAATVEILGRAILWQSHDVDAFAVRDGFASWADLEAFWEAEHEKPRAWSGMLIEWDPATFQPAFHRDG